MMPEVNRRFRRSRRFEDKEQENEPVYPPLICEICG